MSPDLALPSRRPRRRSGPLWLMTLADLALILLGFAMLLHATADIGAAERGRVVAGIRTAFSGSDGNKDERATVNPLPVDLNAIAGFAPGEATLPASPEPLIAWLREAAADPRSRVVVTGRTDGTAGDVDPSSGSAAVLAARRAGAVAAAIARSRGTGTDRLTIVTLPPTHDAGPQHRRVDVAITFDH